MTDVERRGRYLTPAPRRQLAWHRWGLSFLGAVTVASLSTAALGTGAGASPISSDQAKAKQLYGQIQTMNNRVDLLGQRYDLAQIKLHSISNEIKDTRVEVANIKRHVYKGDAQLRQDAVFAYVTNGAAAANNPLFATHASNFGATNVYSQLAQGNITSTIWRG